MGDVVQMVKVPIVSNREFVYASWVDIQVYEYTYTLLHSATAVSIQLHNALQVFSDV